MPEASSWPPPPTVFAAPAPHDAFLTACVLDISEKRTLTRGLLISKLRRESSLGFWLRYGIVADFCDRQQILLRLSRAQLWTRYAIMLVLFFVFAGIETFLWLLERENKAAATDLERTAVMAQALHSLIPLVSIMIALFCIIIPFFIYHQKRLRRAAEDARQKLISQEAMPT